MKYLILLIFIASLTVAQTQKDVISRQEFNSEKEKLVAKKLALLEEKKKLKAQIGELTKELVKLDDPNLKRKICRKYFLKKYGKKIGERILNGQVWKGMTEEMLRDSYGKPDKIDRNKQKWGVFSQWYYGKQIFFFKNGKLIDWEK